MITKIDYGNGLITLTSTDGVSFTSGDVIELAQYCKEKNVSYDVLLDSPLSANAAFVNELLDITNIQ